VSNAAAVSPPTSKTVAPGSRNILYGALLVSVVLLAGSCALVDSSTTSIGSVWFAGAGVLGLLSGFTTGASSETGAGSELLKFVAGAIIAPLLGSVVSLTSVASPAPATAIHPMWALGTFFVGFGLAAVLGVLFGMLLREKGHEIKMKR
jgi:hypothetical protein